MTYKAIRISADRYAALKAQAQTAGSKTLGKYVESLVAASQSSEAQIEQEVARRLQDRITEPEVARLIDAEVSRLLEERGGTSTPSQTDREACARVLLNLLPEATRTFAYEVCEHVLHIQPSQLIHGHLMAAADAGRLQAPLIDPSWETQQTPESEGRSLCEWPECRQPFTPERYGQRFCSNLCGGKAATVLLPPPHTKTLPILEHPTMPQLTAV